MVFQTPENNKLELFISLNQSLNINFSYQNDIQKEDNKVELIIYFNDKHGLKKHINMCKIVVNLQNSQLTVVLT